MSFFRARMIVAVTALIALSTVGTTAQAKDDCGSFAKAIKREVSAAFRDFQATAPELLGSLNQVDGAKKSAAQGSLCHSTGELLGLVRVMRSVGKTCEIGKKEIAKFEQAVEQWEIMTKGMCAS
jgi:hypothetical protein